VLYAMLCAIRWGTIRWGTIRWDAIRWGRISWLCHGHILT